MNTFTLWKLFHRRGARGIGERTSALAVIAFAAATTIFLTVLGGVHGFIWRASADHTLGCLIDSGSCAPGTYEAWKHALDEANAFVADPGTRWTAERSAAVMDTYAGGHVILAAFACLMLIVPFISLAGSAARLAGATTAQVVKLTALDAAIQALFGAIIGIIGYVAVMPLIMLLKFQNRHFTFEQLWVGLPVLAGVLVGVTVLALVSSLITLRRVAITPLGVMNRAAQPLPAAWRALIFLVVMAGLYAMLSNASMFAGFAGLGENAVLVLVFGAFFVGFTMVNVVGTWVIAKRAKARARRRQSETCVAQRVRRGIGRVHRRHHVRGHFGEPAPRRRPTQSRDAVHARYRHRWPVDARVRGRARRGQFRCDAGRQRVRSGRRIPHAALGRYR